MTATDRSEKPVNIYLVENPGRCINQTDGLNMHLKVVKNKVNKHQIM